MIWILLYFSLSLSGAANEPADEGKNWQLGNSSNRSVIHSHEVQNRRRDHAESQFTTSIVCTVFVCSKITDVKLLHLKISNKPARLNDDQYKNKNQETVNRFDYSSQCNFKSHQPANKLPLISNLICNHKLPAERIE